jgi:uncharacterized protein (TIGR03067 family)
MSETLGLRQVSMHRQRNGYFWIFVVICVVMTIIAFNRDRADDKLVGVWKLESTQTNGQPERRERELWDFRYGSLIIVRDDELQEAKIWVDPSASPKHLDTSILFKATGIYRIDGDTLCVSQVVPNQPRPADFRTSWGDMRTVSILRRVATDPRMSTDRLHELLLSGFGAEIKFPERIEFDEEADDFISDLMRNIYDRRTEVTPREEVVFQISWLIFEVNNGGFHQFFYNSTGCNAIETVGFVQKIGAAETATLVEIGCNLFPNGSPSKDIRKRRAQLEQFQLEQLETLRDLQERFYSRREDLNVLLKKYWVSETWQTGC